MSSSFLMTLLMIFFFKSNDASGHHPAPAGNASGHHPAPARECLKASPILKGLKPERALTSYGKADSCNGKSWREKFSVGTM